MITKLQNHEKQIIKVGPLVVQISGNNKISEQIIEEFSQLESDISESIDINLKIHDKKIESYIPKYFSGGYINFNDTKYFVGNEYYFDYVVENAFVEKTLNVDIFIKQPSLNLRQKIKSMKRAELSDINSIIRSAILSFSLFWNIFQLALLKKQCSFIHSATIEKNGQALIFTGTAGAGKTGILLELLKDPKINYMSEDFGIISSDGFSYFNPKAISLYASDVAFGNPIAKQAIEKLPKNVKKKWNLLNKIFNENQMVKILPKNVLGKNRLSEKVKVGQVIYMVREERQEISMEEISIEELSERLSNATMREMKNLVEILSLINADAPTAHNYKNVIELFNMSKNIYLKSFKNLNPKILHIPFKTNPEKICSYLQQKEIL